MLPLNKTKLNNLLSLKKKTFFKMCLFYFKTKWKSWNNFFSNKIISHKSSKLTNKQ